jgi:guanylate kinase
MTHNRTIEEIPLRPGAPDATPPGKLFVVSGPSGVGKDAVLERLLTQLSGVVRSVSATTRAPRPGEVHGVDYYFLTRAEFQSWIDQGNFFEYERYGAHLYGTPRHKIAEMRARGLDVILKIEVIGAQKVRRQAVDTTLIFLQPPSLEELERRLRKRGTDTEARIRERLEIAQTELACIPFYDYLVTNDDLQTAVDAVRSIVIAERCRISSLPLPPPIGKDADHA